MSMQDFAVRLKSPFLKEVFPLIWFPEFSMFPLMAFMAGFHQQRSGYPLGGSLEFSRAIEKRYLDLGGWIQYKIEGGQGDCGEPAGQWVSGWRMAPSTGETT